MSSFEGTSQQNMLSGDNNLTDQSDNNLINKNISKLSKFCFEWLEMFAQATIFVIVMFVFVFKIVNVSGTSMLKTLNDGDRLIINKWYYKPENGDIVVARKGQNLNMPIIKRVIATEGQTLKIDYESGTVVVNGEVLDEFYVNGPMVEMGDIEIPVVIPKNYIFVMGDNRNNSWDSRFAVVGLIKNEDVVGKVMFRIYPFDRNN